MSFPKAQHYLPRFYLRGFGVQKGRQHYVHVWDLAEERAFYTSVKRIGHGVGFYDVRVHEGVKITLEPHLARLEAQWFAPALVRLLRTRDPAGLTAEDRAAIAAFIATTHLRGPALREFLVQATEGARDALARKIGRPLTEDEVQRLALRPLTQDELTYLSGNLIFRTGGTLAQIIVTMKWVLGAPPPGRTFPTSDNPVVLYNPLPPPGPISNIGFACKGIQVFFPVSADFVLLAYHEEDYPHLEGVLQFEDENLLHLTDLLVTYASRFVISRDGRLELRPGMKRAGRRVEVL